MDQARVTKSSKEPLRAYITGTADTSGKGRRYLIVETTRTTLSTWKIWSTSRRSWRKATWQKWRQLSWGRIAMKPGSKKYMHTPCQKVLCTSLDPWPKEGCCCKASSKHQRSLVEKLVANCGELWLGRGPTNHQPPLKYMVGSCW